MYVEIGERAEKSSSTPARICTEEGCGKKHNARGLCRYHYLLRYQRDYQREWKAKARQRNREEREAGKEQRRIDLMVERLPRAERAEYECRGILEIIPTTYADEDMDPTPPPSGCPGCWRHTLGSAICDSCPDAEAQRIEQRAEFKRRPQDRVILSDYAR